MEIVSAGLTIVILGLLYWRMIKRETPERIGAFQALLPFALGVASMFLGALATILLAKSLGGMANILAEARCCAPSSWPAVRKKWQSCL